jgi:hypothetical protein
MSENVGASTSHNPKASIACIAIILPLPSYLREKEVSSLLQLKTKYRNQLRACANSRLNLTNIEPDIQERFKSRQAQPPH